MRGWWSSWYTHTRACRDTGWPISEHIHTRACACVCAHVFSATAHWLPPQTTGSLCYSHSLVVTSTGRHAHARADTHTQIYILYIYIQTLTISFVHADLPHTLIQMNSSSSQCCLMHTVLWAKWNLVQFTSATKSLSKGGWVMPTLSVWSCLCDCCITRCSVTGLKEKRWWAHPQISTVTPARTDRHIWGD